MAADRVKEYLCLWVTVLVVLVGSLPASTSAHVLVKDRSGTAGAVYHSTPGDDPVAGQTSTLYFDVSLAESQPEDYWYRLIVTSDQGQSREIYPSVSGTLASSDYYFSRQGTYKIQLSLEPKSAAARTAKSELRPINFAFTQQVVRGGLTSGATHLAEHQMWVEPLLVGSSSCLAVLALLAFNNRKRIIEYSNSQGSKKGTSNNVPRS